MFRRNYNVIVVPDDHSGTRQYRVSLGLILATVLLLVALLGTMVVFMATYGTMLQRARTAQRLESENLELRDQILQVNELNDQLEELSALRAQIVALLGGDLGLDDASLLEMGEVELPLASLEPERFDHLSAAEVIRSYAPTRWPVDGDVTREFFLAGRDGPHPGLDVAAVPGSAVVASGRGRVVGLGHSPEQGKHVILDHGLGIQSVYGGLDRIAVEAGQMVDRSQPLAYLGSPTDGGQPELFFAVRVDGEPIDPRRYLTRHPRE